MNNAKTKILKNISWLLFDKVIRIFGGLIVGIWIARYLGPHDFGVLNYALAYIAFFTVFSKLGLDQIVVREITRKRKATNYLLGSAFGLKAIGGISAILFLLLSLYFTEIDTVTKSVILVLSIGFILQPIDVIDYFYQSKILSKYVVIARNSAFIISSLIKIYFILYQYDVIYFAIANVIDIFLASLFLLLIYRHTNNNLFEWKFSKKLALKLLTFSWPLALSAFLISIHTKIDQVMIGNMLDTTQVGIYSVAVRLSDFWIFIPGILVSTLMPYFIKLKKQDNVLYHNRLLQLYSLMFWMGAGVGILTIMFGQDIILLLFGKSYIGAYEALVFNIWNGIFISQAIARSIWMLSEDLQIYRLYGNLIIVILNISLNLVLIPKLGITGAALSTLLTQALGTWAVSLLWKPLRPSTIAMLKAINPVYLLNIQRKNL